jgi:hypothetical protein
MSKERRELIADWTTVVGGLALLASLFLTWSHQFSRPFLVLFGATDQLKGVPHNPTAWQVYSAADVILALLAAGLVAVALIGSRGFRFAALLAAIVALVFTVHALGSPPTNGATIFNPALSVPNYEPNSPGAGIGETVAILGLVLAMGGLVLSFTAD